jgi:hypothetical protein
MTDENQGSDDLQQRGEPIEKRGIDLQMIVKLDRSVTARNDDVAVPRQPVLLDPNIRCESD